jgi:hypothetical protein
VQSSNLNLQRRVMTDDPLPSQGCWCSLGVVYMRDTQSNIIDSTEVTINRFYDDFGPLELAPEEKNVFFGALSSDGQLQSDEKKTPLAKL